MPLGENSRFAYQDNAKISKCKSFIITFSFLTEIESNEKFGPGKLYSPPPPPMGISETGKVQKVRGVEYNQSTIDVPGTPEGVRIPIKGTVDGAPRPVALNIRNSPLVFFLIEENPKDLEHPVYHEVWAVKAPRQALKNAKLVKGSEIEVIVYRHTIETPLIGGGRQVITRHNLTKILSVKKPSPKERKI